MVLREVDISTFDASPCINAPAQLSITAKLFIAFAAFIVIIGEIAGALSPISALFIAAHVANRLMVAAAIMGATCKFAAECVSAAYYCRYVRDLETYNSAIKLHQCFRAMCVWRLSNLVVTVLAILVFACFCAVNTSSSDIDFISLFAAYAIIYGAIIVVFLIYIAYRCIAERWHANDASDDLNEYSTLNQLFVAPPPNTERQSRQVAQVM